MTHSSELGQNRTGINQIEMQVDQIEPPNHAFQVWTKKQLPHKYEAPNTTNCLVEGHKHCHLPPP